MKHDQDTQTERDEEGFLSRWSRRKQEVRDGLPHRDEEDLRLAAEPEPVKEDYQPSDADMPPIESLTEDSDYSGFMSPRVSEELRRLALRKLFHSSGFNIRDGLNDYDDDYTEFEKLGDIVTCDMKFQAQKEQLRQAQAEQEARDQEARQAVADEELEAAGVTETGNAESIEQAGPGTSLPAQSQPDEPDDEENQL